MARRSGSSLLAVALIAAVVFVSLPALTPTFVGGKSLSQAPPALRGPSASSAPADRSSASQTVVARQAGGAPPNRINLAFLGFIAGMAVLGLLAAFFYGSYVGLGSSL
mmetsp:Transcript_64159/g.152991  ORF Transcript_64159/g.152991 Transcript_64159/m.152991 type:complete len:108 (+) Transcript_64159:97-420(+)|eukprot:CAMPEP_0178414518 /NCGR_PEP_ID=MMETSP0689_2-20121128/23076_1 /TAXON_ID=160604 /ORGANISM="Amphidinium massartii, Strain CS-259" /LENGTH=107 /DNA_ID=CAMNT_0020035807 /DNA_START=95 /DNA_END=418 /DNA_ORIENTATION=-